jgi:hypothetical protein
MHTITAHHVIKNNRRLLGIRATASGAPGHFYWERQRDGLCRMHAINAFLHSQSVPVLDKQKFREMCEKFDALGGHPPGTTLQTDTMTNLDSMLTFVVRFFCPNACVFPIPFTNGKEYIVKRGKASVEHHTMEHHTMEHTCEFMFVFNQEHVWLTRKDLHTGNWYEIDSMSGIRPCMSVSGLLERDDLGFVVIVEEKHVDTEVDIMLQVVENTIAPWTKQAIMCVPSSHNLSGSILRNVEPQLHAFDIMMRCHKIRGGHVGQTLEKFLVTYIKNPDMVGRWLGSWEKFRSVMMVENEPHHGQ